MGVTARCSAGAALPDRRWSRCDAGAPRRRLAKTGEHGDTHGGLVVDGSSAEAGPTARQRLLAGLTHDRSATTRTPLERATISAGTARHCASRGPREPYCDPLKMSARRLASSGATRAQRLGSLGRRRLLATHKRATNSFDIDVEPLRKRGEAVRMERLSQSECDQERTRESVLRQLRQ